MPATKTLQLSMRRLALQPTSRVVFQGLAAPAAIAVGSIHRRTAVSTTKLTSDRALLDEQRLRRPVAPHLTIYRPQITWVASGLNRLTGVLLAGGVYLFAAAYVAAPAFGWHLETQSIAAAFATLPVFAKVLTKLVIAFPFTFHAFNGIRHLTWDLGKQFGKQTVIKTGWTVVGLTVVSSLALSFFY